MASMEEIGMSRYAQEVEDDLRHLLGKYCRIMGWNIPEIDEKRARELIVASMQDALAKIQDA